MKSVDRENASVVVVFSDREEGSDVVYEEDGLEELSLAYAMSVHKSQGSEFPIVVLALPRVMPELMTRNLLYTAVTRAQRFVVLVRGLKASWACILQTTKPCIATDGWLSACRRRHSIGDHAPISDYCYAGGKRNGREVFPLGH